MNIKIIILSSEDYKSGNYGRIVQCKVNEDESVTQINPEFYLITDYTGNHYKSVGYNGQKMFSFEELPEFIKKKIVETCMNRDDNESGVFKLIPDFVKFKEITKLLFSLEY